MRAAHAIVNTLRGKIGGWSSRTAELWWYRVTDDPLPSPWREEAAITGW
jgi:hypothetical protein